MWSRSSLGLIDTVQTLFYFQFLGCGIRFCLGRGIRFGVSVVDPYACYQPMIGNIAHYVVYPSDPHLASKENKEKYFLIFLFFS